MSRGHTTVVRGWSIVDKTAITEIEDSINKAIFTAGGAVEMTTVTEIKGFSTTRIFVCFESWMNLPV